MLQSAAMAHLTLPTPSRPLPRKRGRVRVGVGPLPLPPKGRRGALRLISMLILGAAAGGAAAAEAPPGASSCSGCHAASAKLETAIPPVRGRDPAEIAAAMREFRSGERPSTVM